jgi:SAM-dependent methyltransferase
VGAGLPFGQVADFYDRGRPGYPEAVIRDVLEFSGVESPRVLEVGAGTGKATELAARHSLRVVAIEPSPEMAAIARRACARYPSVSITVSTFEDWVLEPDGFDVVMSAQAFHWVSHDVRCRKARAALRDPGALALFWSHPRWADCSDAEALATAYDRFAPELVSAGPWFPRFDGPVGAERPASAELEGLFGPVTELRYPWSASYTAAAYSDLLRSLAEHERLPFVRLVALLDVTRQVIEAAGGSVDIPYETRLYLAHAVGR